VHESFVSFFVRSDPISEEVVITIRVNCFCKSQPELFSGLLGLLSWTPVAEATGTPDVLVPDPFWKIAVRSLVEKLVHIDLKVAINLASNVIFTPFSTAFVVHDDCVTFAVDESIEQE
jgi:hypothetical protein